jgi:hypothetical protein
VQGQAGGSHQQSHAHPLVPSAVAVVLLVEHCRFEMPTTAPPPPPSPPPSPPPPPSLPSRAAAAAAASHAAHVHIQGHDQAHTACVVSQILSTDMKGT